MNKHKSSMYLPLKVGLNRINKEDSLRIGQGLASRWQSIIRKGHESSPVVLHRHIMKSVLVDQLLIILITA